MLWLWLGLVVLWCLQCVVSWFALQYSARMAQISGAQTLPRNIALLRYGIVAIVSLVVASVGLVLLLRWKAGGVTFALLAGLLWLLNIIRGANGLMFMSEALRYAPQDDSTTTPPE